MEERPDGVVALSRWRAVLARSRNPRKRLELVLGDPHAATLVPRIPVEDFYYLVRGVGLEDAGRCASVPGACRGCRQDRGRDRLSTPRSPRVVEIMKGCAGGAARTIMRSIPSSWP